MNTQGFRRLCSFAGSVLLATSVWPTLCHATQVTYGINADGVKEVDAAGAPNKGDLDGSATGTLVLDNGTGSGTTGSATFSITLSNVDLTTLSGHHIHMAPATTTGSIVVDFGDPDTIRTGSTLSGTITGLPAATITSIFANTSGFYYNIHNLTFQGGAVRDQLVPIPEPGLSFLALAGLAGLTMLARRRH